MRVLVCGGRDYSDTRTMYHFMNNFHKENKIEVLIHGAARGADSMAGRWAQQAGINIDVYPAQWDKYGSSAGPIRNKQMLIEGQPDIVIAFPGGGGTANMVRQARQAGVQVIKV